MTDLSVEIAGLKLRNPTILASGFLGISAATLTRVVEAGAGAVVSKSAAMKPREGFPGPNIAEVDSGLLNAIGLSNPGIAEMRSEIQAVKKSGVPIIASVFGFDRDEYASAAAIAAEAGANAIELNLSCPHVEGVGEIGQDPQLVRKVTAAVRSKVQVPLFVKLSPNVTSIAEIGSAAEKAGANGLTAINTVKAMAIDPWIRLPVTSSKFAGLSGRPIKPIAVRCVYELAEAVKIPIIGVGGVTKWEDAVEFMLAGASAVQVGTALLHGELSVFREICKGLEKYMSEEGFAGISDLVGLAHE